VGSMGSPCNAPIPADSTLTPSNAAASKRSANGLRQMLPVQTQSTLLIFMGSVFLPLHFVVMPVGAESPIMGHFIQGCLAVHARAAVSRQRIAGDGGMIAGGPGEEYIPRDGDIQTLVEATFPVGIPGIRECGPDTHANARVESAGQVQRAAPVFRQI